MPYDASRVGSDEPAADPGPTHALDGTNPFLQFVDPPMYRQLVERRALRGAENWPPHYALVSTSSEEGAGPQGLVARGTRSWPTTRSEKMTSLASSRHRRGESAHHQIAQALSLGLRHWCPSLAGESSLEFRHVDDHAIDAVLRRRVWIRQRPFALLLGARVLACPLREANEKSAGQGDRSSRSSSLRSCTASFPRDIGPGPRHPGRPRPRRGSVRC